jgi:hypothetical protein
MQTVASFPLNLLSFLVEFFLETQSERVVIAVVIKLFMLRAVALEIGN